MDLFQEYDYVGHAGGKLTWKIECDAISDAEWEVLANLVFIVLFEIMHETKEFSKSCEFKRKK